MTRLFVCLFVCLPKQRTAFPINGGIYELLRLKNGIEISSVALNKPDGLNVFRSVYAQTFLIAWGDLRFFGVQGDQHVNIFITVGVNEVHRIKAKGLG